MKGSGLPQILTLVVVEMAPVTSGLANQSIHDHARMQNALPGSVHYVEDNYGQRLPQWYNPVMTAAKEASEALAKRCQSGAMRTEEHWIQRRLLKHARSFGSQHPGETAALFEAIHVLSDLDFYLHCTCPHWREAKSLLKRYGGAYFGEDTENPPSP